MFRNNKNFLVFFLIILLGSKITSSHPLSDDMANLVEKLSPAVVNVFTVQKNEKASNDNNQQMPFENLPPQKNQY